MYRTSIGKCLVFFSRPKYVVTQCNNFKLTQVFGDNFIEQINLRQNLRCLYVTHNNSFKMASPVSGKKSEKPQLRVVRVREKKSQYGSDKWPTVSLQIIGSGTKDSTASVMIIAGTNRMIFNCGEGMQRLLLENGIKSMSKFQHLFFTRLTWDNVGGTIGMAIGLKAMGVPKVCLHGSPQLEQFTQAFQRIVKHENLYVETRPYTDGDIDIEAGVITPVPLFASTGTQIEGSSDAASSQSSSSSSASSDDSEPEMGQDAIDKRKARSNKPSGPSKKRRRVATPNLTVAYVCKLHSKPGKLLMNKIKEFGVRPHGPHLTDLKKGIPHTTEDGRVVKPEDVLGPSEPAIYFIVLECPSEDYIEAVTTNEVFSRHHAGNDSDTAKIVFHISPQEVIDNSSYQEWMKKFGPSTEHVVLNQSNNSPIHFGAHRLQTKLNLLHQGIFPQLLTASTEKDKTCAPTDQGDDSFRLQEGETFMLYHLRPDLGWTREHVPSDNVKEYLKEVEELPQEFHSSLEDLKNSLEILPSSHGNINNKYPELVFTGTGSAVPMRDRNVTGILLNVSETQSLLLDCGDGTYGQLYRFYGSKHVDDIIAKLHCIFVSHIHLDHHSGLIQIVLEWNRIMDERGESNRKLIIVGPTSLKPWLAMYDAECEPLRFKRSIKFIDLRALSYFENDVVRNSPSPHVKSLLELLDLTQFDTVPVRHCFNSHAVVLTHRSGWKLAYSGDCMPSHKLVQVGQNADVLIHEATLEDGMNEEAFEKRHSMISEAIDVGNRMNAKFTLLTHFSQRYMRIPYFKSEVKGQVGITYDNMRVSFSELPILPKFLPVLNHLFADKISDMIKQRHKKEEREYLENLAKLAEKSS
ncbi:zinc phosphodiesterase ELAC protein 2-like [Amphiura filiformis]|uniref:zinc phosphodiesterase ELAC protein 2-like n=1 Tax=Amphiura filiformis TaxID=82378 RepID=UPI003B21049A